MLNLVKWGVDNWGKTYWAAIPDQIIIIYWKWQKHVTQSNTALTQSKDFHKYFFPNVFTVLIINKCQTMQWLDISRTHLVKVYLIS